MVNPNNIQFINQIRKFNKYNFMILAFIFLIQIPYINSNFKILEFKSHEYRAGHFAFDSNGNMIIEYSKDNYRLFYGLKKDGKYFFGEETPTKEIQVNNNGGDAKRYESRNIFVTNNNDNTKQYLFSIGVDASVVELHDFGADQYIVKPTSDFLGKSIFSYVFSILELGNSSQKEYLVTYFSERKYIIQKFSFSDFSLSSSIITDEDPYVINYDNRLVCSCVIDNLIALFYVNWEYKYAINIYNFELGWLNKYNEIILDQISGFPEGYGIFSKCYHLKDRLIILIYFTSQSSNSLKLKIGNINTDNSFTDILNKELTEFNFKTNDLLNDFVKINEERFIFVGLPSTSSQSLSILLIDLYNNYNNMKIRSYDSNLNNLYEVNQELSADVYNNLLVFSSTVVTPGSTNQFSIFMMFGYANGTDETIDISEYFMDDYINSDKNIVTELTKDIVIENNIFGYAIKEQLKLVSVPEELLFYNKINGNEILLNNNDILNKDYIFKQNINKEKTNDFYSFDYQLIIQEKDYNDFNLIANNIVDFPASDSPSYVDQSSYFQPKEFLGRTNTLKFKLCHEFCATCVKFGISNDNQQCMSCLEDYQFDYFNEYPSNCIPEGYFNDKEEGKIVKCTDTNSKFYYDEERNKTICFKKIYDCPESYPYLNSSSNECQKNGPQETQIITYSSLLNNQETQISTYSDSLNEQETQISTYTNSFNEQETQINTYSDSLNNQETQISTYSDSLNDQKTQISTYSDSLNDQGTQISTYSDSLNDQETQINTYSDSINEQETQISPYSDSLNVPETQICTYNNLINDQCSFLNHTNLEIYNKIKNEIIQTYPNDGESVVIEGLDEYVFQLTTSLNEIKSIEGEYINDYDLSMIDLGQCETLIKQKYEIDSPLIIIKFEKLTPTSSEKNVQYEVYNPMTKTKINLSICVNTPVDLYIPVSLSERTKNLYEDLQSYGYDLFNPEDPFYQDICTPYTSENNTDVLLSDRRIDYFVNDSTCQANCEYSEYNIKTNLLKCECEVINEDIDTEEPKKFSGEMVLTSFYDVLKYSNIKVLKCFKLVFDISSIINNYGSLLVIAFFLIYLCFLFVYFFKGINPLKISIGKLFFERPNNKKDASNEWIKQLKKHKKSSKAHKHKTNFPPKKRKIKKRKVNTDDDDYDDGDDESHNYNLKNKKIKKKSKKQKNVIIKNDTLEHYSHLNTKSPTLTTKRKMIETNIIFDTKNQEDNSSFSKHKMEDFELNELEYLEAIELDKRPFYRIYWATLKREHLILFTFFSNNDYNLVYVKIERFIFLICTDLAMNAFFFSDDSMHKVYINYGKYDFIQQIPQILYSTIISHVIEVIICYFSMTDKYFYQIKNLEKNLINKCMVFKILKCIKLKIYGFFIFTFIFFVFYWYFISAFCAVYKNTQIIFIKDSFSSFITSLLDPFCIYAFTSFLRVIALKDINKKRLKIIYNLSDIIPIF